MRNVIRGPALNAFKRSLVQQGSAAVANAVVIPAFTRNFHASYPRYQSTLTVDSPTSLAQHVEKGRIEKTLKALDMSVVRQIKAELMEVDANSDGRQVQKR
jgi:hypothetical protein